MTARIPDRLPGLRPLEPLKFGDRIVTNEGEPGTVTAPPDERHPRTARVALDNGDLYDMGLSRFKRITPPDLLTVAALGCMHAPPCGLCGICQAAKWTALARRAIALRRSAFAVSAEERTWPQAASPSQTSNRVGS